MKNPHKALEAIENLVGSDFGMEMECFLYEGVRLARSGIRHSSKRI